MLTKGNSDRNTVAEPLITMSPKTKPPQSRTMYAVERSSQNTPDSNVRAKLGVARKGLWVR